MWAFLLQKIIKIFEDTGFFFVFLGNLFKYWFKRPIRWHLYMYEIEHLGVNSVPVILLAGLAIGMIFALQSVVLLQPFQAEIGTGAAVAVALAQELAPIITTLMLIAKNGSAMAAELGTMRVTEQIDALESMSIDPIHYLVVPRVVASILVFPVLTMLANLVGSLGSFFISTTLYGIDSASYTDYMFNVLKTKDIAIGLIKSVVMGFMVSTISCFHGLHVSQGAKGVGEGATKAVVTSSVAILVADYILTTVMRPIFFGR
ncbi:MAG TPA: ABC transporter permease [Treponema sp.]|nr:ABC transporter permease [Treponema sp.]HPC70647.1 ABC transporter permease [Treponema sp.]HRS03101.1 ABC transporter permease [Treponema sp.]HRU27895.1 ABC transporter permease [Treponema sp.]